MQFQTHTSLKPFNTFGIDVCAHQYCSVSSIKELKEALHNLKGQSIFILGGGSNMLLRNDLSQPVIHINLKGVEVIQESDDEVLVEVMAGENWHEFVMWCLERDYGGVENLSLIPGNVGAAPIQNIGAYGVEMKDCFHSCEALKIDTLEQTIFFSKDCDFGYRESVFKGKFRGEYIITKVVFRLTVKNHLIKSSYGAIADELYKKGIDNPTIKDISKAVIAIRSSKLPDPKDIGNSGSFFKNPVISKTHFESLRMQHAEIPGYKVSDSQIKVPAGWLIERAGFKGKRFGEYGVHEKQALVLVNYGNAKGNDIYKLARLIQKTIHLIFGIDLEMEVNVI